MNIRGHINSLELTNPRTFFVTQAHPSMTTKPGVSEIIFATRGMNGTQDQLLYVTKFLAHMKYVDVNVTCRVSDAAQWTNCGVDAIRQATIMPADPLMTPLKIMEKTGDQGLFEDFTDMIDYRHGSGPFFTERYIYSSGRAFDAYGTDAKSNYSSASLSHLDIKLFERRFSLMWNTLWRATWEGYNPMKNTAMRSFGGQNIYSLHDTIPTTTYALPPVYAVDPTWITIYFVSVAVMFVAANFSLVVHSRCRAPPILGFVSTLMRYSRYFADSDVSGNSAENGSDRSKRLGKLKVMVADVRGDQKFAVKIAFAPVGMGKRVTKGRWYE